MQDEQSLVRRAQQRDPEALAQLYEEHFDKIYRYVALRIGDKMEAEDLTQQVFLHALQSITSFKWKAVPLSAWLFRIAHNQVIDYMRKRSRRVSVPLDESFVSDSINPQSIVEQRLDLEQVMLATERLTESQREVISLRFAGELSIAEVARIMGKSQGAVKALQHSAIVSLRKALLVVVEDEKD
ncbi:MAG: sigma-70 family RNA polymerase sigma factor [Dehalococcoidales bacterium]|nr:sigma-70 family RNA polymerase sigma factor [Dehalococcoidales bacterium]